MSPRPRRRPGRSRSPCRGVEELDRRAEDHAPVVVEQRRVDDLRVGELRLELDDAALDEALALARRLVLAFSVMSPCARASAIAVMTAGRSLLFRRWSSGAQRRRRRA
jgi:hypothetical protein